MYFFPQVSLVEWCNKYKDLKVKETECLKCEKQIQTLIPFFTEDYIGLIVYECPTCNINHKTYSVIPRTKEEARKWSKINECKYA